MWESIRDRYANVNQFYVTSPSSTQKTIYKHENCTEEEKKKKSKQNRKKEIEHVEAIAEWINVVRNHLWNRKWKKTKSTQSQISSLAKDISFVRQLRISQDFAMKAITVIGVIRNSSNEHLLLIEWENETVWYYDPRAQRRLDGSAQRKKKKSWNKILFELRREPYCRPIYLAIVQLMAIGEIWQF